MDAQRVGRFIEFLVIGIVMGVTEDVIAIAVATEATITLEIIGIIILVAIPFAAVSELIVDHPAFGVFEQIVERVAEAR